MPPDGRVDRSGERVGVPLHDRVVDLLDLALLEGALERGVGTLGLGDDHESARADVEAVHDALPLGSAGRRDPDTAGGQCTEHGRALPADGRVRGDAGGLVDDDDLVIVVDDAEIGHRERARPAAPPSAPRHLEPGPRRAAGRTLPSTRPSMRDAAGVGDIGRERAREARASSPARHPPAFRRARRAPADCASPRQPSASRRGPRSRGAPASGSATGNSPPWKPTTPPSAGFVALAQTVSSSLPPALARAVEVQSDQHEERDARSSSSR